MKQRKEHSLKRTKGSKRQEEAAKSQWQSQGENEDILMQKDTRRRNEDEVIKKMFKRLQVTENQDGPLLTVYMTLETDNSKSQMAEKSHAHPKPYNKRKETW